MKTILLFAFLCTMIGTFFLCSLRTYIYITITFIFFPIIMSFMGQDAITTGTISIFLLYLKYFINFRPRIRENYDYWIYLLIFAATLSIIVPYLTGALTQSQLGPAARHYMGFLGALLLFIVIKNALLQDSGAADTSAESKNIEIDALLNFVLLLLSIHILIGLCIKYYPAVGSVFQPFLSSEIDSLDVYGRGQIERIGTFVFGYESQAEILATLCPIILYKMFTRRTTLWFFLFLLFGVGVVFTATRSGVLLFSFGVIISIAFYARPYFGKAYAFFYFLTSVVLLVFIFHPSSFADLMYRFQEVANIYNSGGTFVEMINRDSVFLPAWELTLSNLSFFGNGITEFNYHNLYLTILHQLGIIGSVIFFSVLLYPVGLVLKNCFSNQPVDKYIFFSLLLSLSLFLINEFKYEFNRDSSYQQICWAFIGICYLIAKHQIHHPFSTGKIN